jgi:hypothetical protein
MDVDILKVTAEVCLVAKENLSHVARLKRGYRQPCLTIDDRYPLRREQAG